jgi:DNA helicase HerA-like ATPase
MSRLIKELKEKEYRAINSQFSGKMLIVDEAHNLRDSAVEITETSETMDLIKIRERKAGRKTGIKWQKLEKYRRLQ